MPINNWTTKTIACVEIEIFKKFTTFCSQNLEIEIQMKTRLLVTSRVNCPKLAKMANFKPP